MNVYEMEGFLRGKCMPRDILVNESTAEYLVRKLNEATTVKAERDALADKCAKLDYNLGNALIGEQEVIRRSDALAVENAALKSSVDLIASAYTEGEPAGFEIDRARNIKTPATSAALAAIEARGVEKAAAALDSLSEKSCSSTSQANFRAAAVYLRTEVLPAIGEAK